MDGLSIIISFIKGLFLILRRSAEEQHASRVKLSDEYKDASINLCVCLAEGTESLKAIVEELANYEQKEGGSNSSAFELRMACSKMISSFNKGKLDYLTALDSLCLQDRNPDEFGKCKNTLDQLFEDYTHDLLDLSYIVKLAQGISSSLSKDNSELLKNIISLYGSPHKRINEIIFLRFGVNPLRDYYSELQTVCNSIAEIVNLPVHNNYSIIVSPFKVGFGNPEHQYRLGLLFLNQGNQRDAIIWLERAIEKGYLDANLVLGRLLLEEGREDGGLSVLKSAAEKNHSPSIFELGLFYFNKKQADKAIRYFSCISNYRRDAMLFLARSYEAIGETAKSIELYDELVGVRGANLDLYGAVAMYHIVDTFFALKLPLIDFAKVLDYYERVLEEVHSENSPWNNYLQVLIPLQKMKIHRVSQIRNEEAGIISMRFLEHNSAIAECDLGWTFINAFVLGEPMWLDEANKMFSLAANQRYPEAYVGLGVVMISRGLMESDVRIAYQLIQNAATQNFRDAYYLLTVFHSMDLTAKWGLGNREDGLGYEKEWHTGRIHYYYVSNIDHRIYESTITDGFFDPSYYNGSDRFWWLYREDVHIFDKLTELARLDSEGFFEQEPYTATEPGVVWSETRGVGFIIVLRGRIKIHVYAYSDGDLLHSIELGANDAIHAFWMDPHQKYVVSSLESGTVFRSEKTILRDFSLGSDRDYPVDIAPLDSK